MEKESNLGIRARMTEEDSPIPGEAIEEAPLEEIFEIESG